VDIIKGFLLIDKPAGITSYDVIRQFQKLYPGVKIGHGGTLDPFATGLLILAFGSYTKKLNELSQSKKVYQAKIYLGFNTKTDDLTGERINEVLPRMVTDVQDLEITSGLTKLVGEYEQMPPRFSAKHVDGKRAYDLAREGKDFELKPKTVRVERIEIGAIERDEKNEKILVDCKIECSEGTYIRSIARDLGEILGVGGHLVELRRIQIGDYKIENAHLPADTNFFDFIRVSEEANILPTVWTFGKYDGMHQGHQKVLEETILARNRLKSTDPDTTAVAVIIHDLFSSTNENLQTLKEKVKQIQNLGIDQIVVQNLSQRFKSLTFDELQNKLSTFYNCQQIISGPQQKLGADQQSTNNNPEIPDLSSSKIKTLLNEGKIEEVNQLLGHPYTVRGKVVHGENRGEKIGFPTANLGQIETILPGAGVYGGLIKYKNKTFPAVASIGKNLTFDQQQATFEIHIIDFNQNIYNQWVDFSFLIHLRDMQKFNSVDELKNQIHQDIDNFKHFLEVNKLVIHNFYNS